MNFAFQDERIRIVTLEGSRTNVNIPKDNLQDYDITFFVIDMGEFLKSDDWLSVFGNRIMMQKPEDMELFPPEEKGFSYIMLFDDGVKIDLTLLPVSMLEEYLTRDKLVKIMLDKDNMIKTEMKIITLSVQQKESLMTVVTNFGMLQHMYPRAYFVVKYYLQ